VAEYFDEARKEKWRKDHRGIPEPQVWCRDATAAEMPGAARLAFQRAQTVGWTSVMTYARGSLLDSEGLPAYHVNLIPLWDEGNNPILTPTGQQANQEEKTTEPVLVESVVLRADSVNGKWIRAIWEHRIPRTTEEKPKWRFVKAFVNGRPVKAAEMTKELREP
jgi:hypothetical protein